VRSRTSIAAAEAIRDMAPTMRGKVFGYLCGAANGATRQEIADGLGMRLQTVCGRVGELKKMGLIWDGDETREGRKVLRVSRRHFR
jgi:predicted transcriptional regulator